MNKFLAILSIMAFTNVAQAWQSECKITQSSVRGIETVTVSGPMTERDFRLRLFDGLGLQIETGACDFSGECYERDDRTLNFDQLTRLYVHVTEKNEQSFKMTIYPAVRQGVMRVECGLLL